MATTSVKAECHCKSNSVTIELPTDKLPIQSDLCHCTSCRRASGVLGPNYSHLPIAPFNDIPSTLTGYKSSESATRYFCSTCGAHMFWYDERPKTWCVTAGTLDRMEGIVEVTFHQWLSDTIDGGLAALIDDDMERHVEGRRSPLFDPKSIKSSSLTKPTAKTLDARCHCGAVSYTVTRPNEDSKEATSSFPDLLVPYNSGKSAENPSNEPWWLRPNAKYLAGTCACTSCRLVSGFEIQTWAFIPRCNIITPSGTSGEPQNVLSWPLKGAVSYQSSPGTYREFCGTCGANMFWRNEKRPELIDVSSGLLDAPEGARAETWLDWCLDRVSFSEEAVNKSLVGSLERGMAKMKEEREKERALMAGKRLSQSIISLSVRGLHIN